MLFCEPGFWRLSARPLRRIAEICGDCRSPHAKWATNIAEIRGDDKSAQKPRRKTWIPCSRNSPIAPRWCRRAPPRARGSGRAAPPGSSSGSPRKPSRNFELCMFKGISNFEQIHSEQLYIVPHIWALPSRRGLQAVRNNNDSNHNNNNNNNNNNVTMMFIIIKKWKET